MSISDEDTTSTTSKRSAKSPPRKIRHRAPPASSSGGGGVACPPSSSHCDPVPLTPQEVLHYAREKVEEVLNGNHEDDGKEIVVIPSLVSLCTTERILGGFREKDAQESRGGGEAGRSLDGIGLGTAAAASTASAAAATGSMLDFPSSFPTLGNEITGSDGDAFVPSLRPRQNNMDMDTSYDIGQSIKNAGNSSTRPTQRPITPPIGPQGAPIPQYILNQRERRRSVDSGEASAAASTGHESVARGTSTSAASYNDEELEFDEPSSPNPRHVFTTNYQDVINQLSAPARLGRQSTQHPKNNSHAMSHGETKYINIVQSLSAAVERMERRLAEGENAALSSAAAPSSSVPISFSTTEPPRTPVAQPPSTPRRQTPSTPVPSTPKQSLLHKDRIDELESSTITKLAEIMLHPPSHKVVNCDDEEEIIKYLWTNENENNDDKLDDDNMQLDDPLDGNTDSDAKKRSISTTRTDAADYYLTEQSLTGVKSRYKNSQAAHMAVTMLGLSIPRRVCQHPFKKNDIVWVCRTCQSDETCVLCHDCFTHSDHEGHDVAFYHAQAGGCCDCGDADAWDPKGFCSKHGGARGKGAPPGSAVAKVEPSVLGGVGACADWLVGAVRDGVEGAYRRANPALFLGNDQAENDKTPFGRSESSSANCDRKDGIATRERIETRRQQSLSRRNTVADMELVDNESIQTHEDDMDESKISSTQPSNMLHEVQFDPAAASTSKKWADKKPSASLSEDASNASLPQFDPEAAGSRATKKAKEAPPEQSPARALGDLGREEQGLFLILHADDIHTGAQPTDAIEALRELYSRSGGGRQDAVGAAEASSDLDTVSFGAPHVFRSPAMAMEPNFPRPRLAPRLGRDANHFLFRAPQVDAILNKIIKLTKKHGNVVVYGTQEIVAETGDVIARCWLHGDPEASARIGAAMLNRAKMLTDKGLVCSIKTHRNLSNDQKATSIIRLIASLADSCDPLCDEVSSGLSGTGISPTLNAIIRSDLKLPCKFTTSWHALLLTLLAQPEFKAALAVAYCDTYRDVTKEYSRGVGVVERSSFTLSVQFLNRVTYVENLVKDRNLLSKLSRSLLESMRIASFIPGSPGSPTPAGASHDTVTQLSSLRTESSDFSAVLMALFGSFSFGEDEQFVLTEIDNELDSIVNDLRGDVNGGDSRYHGRSAVTTENTTNQPPGLTVESLIKRTQTFVNPTLNPMHPFLQHRRYSPCISDLKCVLNVQKGGMSRIFLSLPNTDCPDSSYNDGVALDDWIKTLSLAQNMDAQMWRSFNMGHVESEHRGWVGAFNTSISLGSVFERLLNWEDSDPCIGDPSSSRLLSCAEVAHYTLKSGVHRWQQSEMLSYRPTPHPSTLINAPPHVLCPAALPFSTVASSHGTNLAMAALPLSQIQSWSFHLPLHRFAAACIREVARRPGYGGMDDLLRMFDALSDFSTRQNALLFRGLMEFTVIVLSRSAQIRTGIWRRNGPGMTDQVLNYSEPPFCKALQDSDVLLVQFSLICHAIHQSADLAGFSVGQGTSRLINLLLHRFGVFDFLGFRPAPSADVSQYRREIQAGLYPKEIAAQESVAQENVLLPWTYSPARDFAMSIGLVEEMLSLIIILLTEMPSPPALNTDESVMLSRRRLRREVVHRLASGPKTHSEMAEVHHVLSQRDNAILCDKGKQINPDDASGAALESVLNDVALRRTRIGDADQWELNQSAWQEYDPAFHRIGTRAHQSASERRPKQPLDKSSPYAPKPPKAHDSFKRIRKDLTADAVILSITYKVLHAYCYDKSSLESKINFSGAMYESGAKSEASLARAVHILTLGAFAWEENSSVGGTDVGSVFHETLTLPTTNDWVDKALLRNPNEVTGSNSYQKEPNTLILLKRLSSGTMVDPALRSGAMWLCDFAAKHNPSAALLLDKDPSTSTRTVESDSNRQSELERRKAMAKARQQQAMAKMKAQMAKFAETVVQNNDTDDEMSVQEHHTTSSPDNEQPTFSTPLRTRTDSFSVHAMDLGSPGELILTTPPPSTPKTPRTPCSSGSATPKSISYHAAPRLLEKRPQCIICGTGGGDFSIQTDKKEVAPLDDKSLAFCTYVQTSTVAKGDGSLPPSNGLPEEHMKRHVGVFVNLCGHAVHSSCCETYLKTVHRDDRFADRTEGGRRKEFRCPLCQRLSNCLVPFIDVGVDWIEPPQSMIPGSYSEVKPHDNALDSSALHGFLSSSNWWSSRHKNSMIWDGHSSFVPEQELDKQPPPSPPQLSAYGMSTKMQYIFGKKDLISAWNRVLKTPRLVQRSTRGSTPNRNSDSDLSFPNFEPNKQTQRVADVWRRFMDTVSDSALKADTKRLGDDAIINDYGEFRHYMFEKAFYNKANRANGKAPVDWPACISSAPLPDNRRQELSKEKMLSKLLFSIQSFTYSCCSESAEARRELMNSSANVSSKPADMLDILGQFGVVKARFGGNLLLFPEAVSSVDGGSQPFDGRLGKLRYLSLALMVACSPLAPEIVQLCMSIPFSQIARDPFDFDEHLKESEKQRAPVVYPILRGHILTHVTCCLIAVVGRARTLEEGWDVKLTADHCKQFIILGYIARIAQCLLSDLMPSANIRDWKRNMTSVLEKMMSQKSISDDQFENEWFLLCLAVLHAFTSKTRGIIVASDTVDTNDDDASMSKDIMHAIESTKQQAVEFLRDICMIYQLIIPNIFANYHFDESSAELNGPTATLKSFMALLGMKTLSSEISSPLVSKMLQFWFQDATETSFHLETPGVFTKTTWPQTPIAHQYTEDPNLSSLTPLLGCCGSRNDLDSPYFISGLPSQYTDLYAELVLLCPDCEQIALCLVCGEVLDASGKGNCTKHAYAHGGAGIFFLLQECTTLMVHGAKAAYIHSPYVDSHGETPQYRGRPLKLDASRYEILKRLWCGHKVREKVMAERGSTRQVIIPNFY